MTPKDDKYERIENQIETIFYYTVHVCWWKNNIESLKLTGWSPERLDKGNDVVEQSKRAEIGDEVITYARSPEMKSIRDAFDALKEYLKEKENGANTDKYKECLRIVQSDERRGRIPSSVASTFLEATFEKIVEPFSLVDFQAFTQEVNDKIFSRGRS